MIDANDVDLAAPASPAPRLGAQPSRRPSWWRRAAGLFRRLGPTGPLAVAASVLPGLGGLAIYRWLPSIGPWMRSHDGMGPWVCAAVFGIGGGLALIPTYAMSLLCGWSFGFALGLVATLAGFLAAALLGYTLARMADGGRALALMESSPRWGAVHRAVVAGGFGKAALVVALVRLAPIAPFSLTNLTMAAMRVPVAAYLAGTLLGMAPRTALLVFAASRLADLAQPPGDAPWVWLTGAAATVLVVLALGWIGKQALAQVTEPNGDQAEPS